MRIYLGGEMVDLCKKGIGKRVKLSRERSNIPAKAFIDELGITQQGLSKIETGENFPTIQTLAKIANLCSVSTDYILHGNDNLEDFIEDLIDKKFKELIQSKNAVA